MLGWISDRLQSRKIPYALATLPVVGAWLVLAFRTPPQPLLPVLFFAIGFGVGASILGVAFINDIYPPQHAACATSIVNMGGTFGGAFSLPIMGLILQRTGLQVAGFQQAFLVGLGGAVLCLVMTLLFSKTSNEGIEPLGQQV